MPLKMEKCVNFIVKCSLLLLGFPLLVMAQQGRTLDSVEYLALGGRAAVRINFVRLVSYQNHYPEKKGNTLEINIGLLRQQFDDEDTVVGTEVLLAPQSKEIPLVGVTLDVRSPTSPVIIIRFTKEVEYTVKATSDQRGLIIRFPTIVYSDMIKEKDRPSKPRKLLTLEDLATSNEDEAAALINSGKQALQNGKFNTAIANFADVLDLPDHSFSTKAENLLVDTRTQARRLAYARVEQAKAAALLADEPPSTPASSTEIPALTSGQAVVPRPPPPPSKPTKAANAGKTTAKQTSNAIKRQLEFGKLAMKKNDYRTAMRIFSVILSSATDLSLKKEAQALLVEAEAKATASGTVKPRKQQVAVQGQNDQQSGSEKVDIMMQRAEEALKRNDAVMASNILQQVVAIPGHAYVAKAKLLLAQANAVLNASGGAIGALDETQQAAIDTSKKAALLPATATTMDISKINDPKKLMALGRQAMKRNDMPLSVEIFSRVLNVTDHPYVAEAERLLRQATRREMSRPSDPRAPIIGQPSTLEDVTRLLEQGRLALTENNNNRAIVIFTKLTSLPDHPFMKESLELLGVSRQRNSQIAHAKSVYEQFLIKYPEGEDAIRVRQRLADLISSQLKPKQRLKAAKQPAKRAQLRVQNFGSISQYYYYGITQIDNVNDNNADQNSLISYLTANTRARSDRYDIRGVFYATHSVDFTDDDNDGNADFDNDFNISTMYANFRDNKLGLSGRFGRQSSSTAGVLGRFDGLLVGYDIRPKTHINVVAGFPVDLNNKDSIQTNVAFFGVNSEFEDVLPNLDLIPYVMTQTADGILDRFAIGQELRFFHPRGNLFNLIDYSVDYNSLNIFLVNGQYNILQSTSIHFNIDYRNNPILMTRNALINLPGYKDLGELKKDFTKQDIKNFAEDKTGKSTIVTGGASHQFNKTYQLSGDISWTRQKFSDDILATSDGLNELEDSILLDTRLTTTGLFGGRDISILGLSYTNAETYDNTALFLQNRAPFFDGWRFESRFRMDFRDDSRGQQLTRFRPSAKISYSWKRRLNIDVETGIEISKYSGDTNNEDTNRYFGNIGYRWMF